MSNESEQRDILRLLSSKVLRHLFRFIWELAKLITTCRNTLRARTVLATISSRLMRSLKKLNLPLELLLLFLTLMRLLLSVLKNTDKEPSISSVNIQAVLQVPQLDGFQVH